jgi:hypothetical protein
MMTFAEKNVICCRNIESNDKIITFEVKKITNFSEKIRFESKITTNERINGSKCLIWYSNKKSLI